MKLSTVANYVCPYKKNEKFAENLVLWAVGKAQIILVFHFQLC